MQKFFYYFGVYSFCVLVHDTYKGIVNGRIAKEIKEIKNDITSIKEKSDNKEQIVNRIGF